MNCHVCDRPIEAALVAVEVVQLGIAERLVWGPVPAHEGCERAVVTPFDDRFGAGAAFGRVARALDVVPADGGLGLHAIG